MRTPIVLALAALLASAPARAQANDDAASPQPPQAAPSDTGSDAHELAKQLANPVASLISVPLQENMDFGGGYGGQGFKSIANLQPVVPIGLGGVNLIVRTILPIVYQDNITGPSEEQFGLGDTTQSFFISPVPKHPGDLIWAIGPVGYYPTETDPHIGTGKWGAGVTGLVLKQAGKNTLGLLTNQIWSIAGSPNRPDFSSLFLQPFFSHTTRKALTIGINAEATYDWKHEQWVVPLNLTVTQLSKIGTQPVSVGGGVRVYAERPDGAADWGVRLIFTLLFPKK
jgi:hypothetical protein